MTYNTRHICLSLLSALLLTAVSTPSLAREKKAMTWAPRVDVPLVTPVSRPFTPQAGLQDRHIALWHSHGWYFEQSLDRWEFQRGRLLETVEDLYTGSYVLPFLVPMLENAGANVLLPRERDTNTDEYVMDNDGMLDVRCHYDERNEDGAEPWRDGALPGFAHRKSSYDDADRPFADGTYRQAKTVKKGAVSSVEWTSRIDKRGEYAVYVSYKSLPESTRDALYTVHYYGGEASFRVNQQMGGGTWIYLGTFLFSPDQQARVTLSNLSAKKGQTVTADAVKIGGGMGTIARHGQTSRYPRFVEGSRYWLQWAGAPDSVFTPFEGENDYNDDYCSRALWVNWLGGGSDVLPKSDGLHIPLDLSLAFHTDAGVTKSDATIGTLMIYTSETEGRKTYANGASRDLARQLGDLVQTQVVEDIRALHDSTWNRRRLEDAAYFEARVPEIPAILMELLSHQNFADMRLGLDPRFRFTVSRAVYKGMLRFISQQRGTKCVVQPLPVSHFSAEMKEEGKVTLSWQPVEDRLEPTAKPTSYIIYTRVGDGGWDNGVLTSETSLTVETEAGKVYSWRVAALNDGGASFPSEILSAGRPEGKADTKPLLIVNGFQRICAPADFAIQTTEGTMLAGFLDDVDHGVPYIRDISYVGPQKEFRRAIPWMDDDATGFGDSYATHETEVIAGNTFDYPFLHGRSLMALGRAFVSCSREAVEDGLVALADYPLVDLVLGKQYQSKMGSGKEKPLEFKTFTPELQAKLSQYLKEAHGKLMVSGAYVGTDLWDNPLTKADDADKAFAQDVLKYKWRANQASRSGEVRTVGSPLSTDGLQLQFHNKPNSDCYVVEAPDAIEPSCAEAHTIMRYSENNLSAAVAYHGQDYSTCVMGFPFETITDNMARQELMSAILRILETGKE